MEIEMGMALIQYGDGIMTLIQNGDDGVSCNVEMVKALDE